MSTHLAALGCPAIGNPYELRSDDLARVDCSRCLDEVRRHVASLYSLTLDEIRARVAVEQATSRLQVASTKRLLVERLAADAVRAGIIQGDSA